MADENEELPEGEGEEEEQGKELTEVEKVLDEKYQALELHEGFKIFLEGAFEKYNITKKQAIEKADKAWPHETADEVDLRPMIDKFEANQKATGIIHTINQLHVKDINFVKRDLKRNKDIVKNNKDKLMETNGFDFISEKTGISKEKLENPASLSKWEIE